MVSICLLHGSKACVFFHLYRIPTKAINSNLLCSKELVIIFCISTCTNSSLKHLSILLGVCLITGTAWCLIKRKLFQVFYGDRFTQENRNFAVICMGNGNIIISVSHSHEDHFDADKLVTRTSKKSWHLVVNSRVMSEKSHNSLLSRNCHEVPDKHGLRFTCSVFLKLNVYQGNLRMSLESCELHWW